jgi:putative phage-type endonuclease
MTQNKELRRSGIGGSDISAVLGLNRWKTPVELYLEKIGESETTETEPMKWGKLLEELVAREWSALTGKKVRRVNKTVRHNSHPFLMCHPDRDVVGLPEILEIKTSRYDGEKWGEENTDEIPIEYVLQCHWNMFLCGADVCHVPVLFGGNQLRNYIVKADKSLQEKLIGRALHFWTQNVIPKIPPSAGNFRDLGLIYKQDAGLSVIATPEIIENVNRVEILKTEIKEREKELDGLKFLIGDFMRENAYLIDATGKKLVSYKTQERTDVDVKKLREELPDIVSKYERVKNIRVMR